MELVVYTALHSAIVCLTFEMLNVASAREPVFCLPVSVEILVVAQGLR